MATVQAYPRRADGASPTSQVRYLVMDTESIPDGDLIARVKYPGELLTPEAAIERARVEAKDSSFNGSDFLPVTFQIPVAICVVKLKADFSLLGISCLDAPVYRSKQMVEMFWRGMQLVYRNSTIVTFNGRGFDLPLLEMAAFRYGLAAPQHFNNRNRYKGGPLDLLDWMTNFGGCRLTGGLNLLAKLLGKPGKVDVAGDKVLEMYRAGEFQAINDYCMFDTLDTYFVFLRTRIMTGEITAEREAELVDEAKRFLEIKLEDTPVLAKYLANWNG